MTIEIKVPPLGESVTEATIGKWFKKVGDYVKLDEPLVELETDKVTMEINSPSNGVLEEILFQPGKVVKINTVVGKINEKASVGKAADTKPAAKEAPKTQAASTDKSGELSPAVRKIVAENNLTPGQISGTGKDGRITKGDALEALNAPRVDLQVASVKSEERVKMSKLRKRIAERLKESQNTAAMLTTFNEIDMSAVMTLRNQYKDVFEKKHGVKLGFMSFFVKACVAALKELPSVNASIEGDDIIYKNYYDIGVAVGTEQGLVVPIVREADKISLAGIEKGIGDLAKKAREGKLSMQDLTGGTFTITNGGIYGSLLSTPIINPPQTGILGMHKIQERPVAVNGQVVIRPMMYVALSYDHRLIDGKEAVTFLIKVKEAIEDPARLVLDI